MAGTVRQHGGHTDFTGERDGTKRSSSASPQRLSVWLDALDYDAWDKVEAARELHARRDSPLRATPVPTLAWVAAGHWWPRLLAMHATSAFAAFAPWAASLKVGRALGFLGKWTSPT